jgi:hypothetical protein
LIFFIGYFLGCRACSPEVGIYFVTASNNDINEKISKIRESETVGIHNSNKDIKNINISLCGESFVCELYNEVVNSVEVQINFKNCLSLDKIEGVE